MNNEGERRIVSGKKIMKKKKKKKIMGARKEQDLRVK
jgi:hypothetical protein